MHVALSTASTVLTLPQPSLMSHSIFRGARGRLTRSHVSVDIASEPGSAGAAGEVPQQPSLTVRSRARAVCVGTTTGGSRRRRLHCLALSAIIDSRSRRA